MSTERSKLLWVTVISLLVLNFFTLAFIWFHHPPGDHFPQRPPVGEFLVHELNLNDNQVKLFDELKRAHHEKVEKIQKELHVMHDSYFDLLKSDNVDSTKVNSIADQMSALQKETELITFNHFKDVRNILTPEQKTKFDSVIDDVLRMMAPHPPDGHPPR